MLNTNIGILEFHNTISIICLCIMAAATQQYVIPVITNSRRRKNQRFTMSANCLNKNYKLNRRNLIKIQVTQKFQNTGAGIVSNIPNCSREEMKSLPNVMVVNARSVYNEQDACSGVHSACREENRRKVGIYVQLLRQGT